MSEPILSPLLTPLFSSVAMRAVVNDGARLQRMLDFEAALTQVEGELGVIPVDAIVPITVACDADRFDRSALAEASVAAGNLAIPLVSALTAEVAKTDPEAARFVHWGATSQDVIDTALVLELRAAIDALRADLDAAVEGFLAMAERTRHAPSIARTWLQHAVPAPFGLKPAGYAAALSRSRLRLDRARNECLTLQFGGAAGTLAALGDKGLAVSEGLAKRFGLPVPEAPWHTHRDRLAEVASDLAILSGTCGKIARDVSLLMQTEVGEAFERTAPGRGGSSTMPHKRNPVACAAALAAATLAPNLAATIFSAQMQEHERSAGLWAAEWPTFPALCLVTSGALAAIADLAVSMELDTDRMRANIDISEGLVMAEALSFALAKTMGKHAAHALVSQACRTAVEQKRPLRDILAEDSRVAVHIDNDGLTRLFDPLSYQGVAQALIDRLIASVPGGSRPDPSPNNEETDHAHD